VRVPRQKRKKHLTRKPRKRTRRPLPRRHRQPRARALHLLRQPRPHLRRRNKLSETNRLEVEKIETETIAGNEQALAALVPNLHLGTRLSAKLCFALFLPAEHTLPAKCGFTPQARSQA